MTIDCVCNGCGYDFIIDPMTERIRMQEQLRIIQLLADDSPIWDDPRGTQAALLAEIEKDN